MVRHGFRRAYPPSGEGEQLLGDLGVYVHLAFGRLVQIVKPEVRLLNGYLFLYLQLLLKDLAEQVRELVVKFLAVNV